MKNRILLALSLSLSILLSVGCGNKTDYDAYKKEVNKLYDSLAIANVQMNEIEIYSEESKEIFFNNIDNLKKAFEDFSKVETPKEFEENIYLSNKAKQYLENSEKYFRQALDGEYDETSFQNGINNYNQVVVCVNYMGYVLQNKEIQSEEKNE